MSLQFLDGTELYRALVLWFVAMTFLRTGTSGGSHPLVLVASVVALVLSWGVPVFLAVGAAGELYSRTAGDT